MREAAFSELQLLLDICAPKGATNNIILHYNLLSLLLYYSDAYYCNIYELNAINKYKKKYHSPFDTF